MTFNEQMEAFQLACGRVAIVLIREAIRFALLPLRFLCWLNG